MASKLIRKGLELFQQCWNWKLYRSMEFPRGQHLRLLSKDCLFCTSVKAQAEHIYDSGVWEEKEEEENLCIRWFDSGINMLTNGNNLRGFLISKRE